MIGQTIDCYKILEKRGEGGMGVLYKAHDELLDKIVALKTLHPDLVSDPEFREKLTREAKSLGRLNHPNIVSVYRYLIHEGLHFIVMEYVEGRTVAEMIADWGPFSFSDAARVVLQILDALGYAHKNGVVHRDIKPSNILLTGDNVVKVTDFGIAKLLDTEKTRTTQGAGSLYYMAPEQIQHGNVDGRTDIYAVGITFFEMLTATVPFSAETEFLIMKKHIEEPPPAPSSFTSTITGVQDELILHAMEKDPARRFPTTEDFADAVRDALSFADTGAGTSAPKKVKEPTRKEKGAERSEAASGKTKKKKSKAIWVYLFLAVLAAVVGINSPQLFKKLFPGGNGGGPPEINAPPVWVQIMDQTTKVNDTLELAVRATDVNGDTLQLELAGDRPATAWFLDHGDNSATCRIVPRDSDVGTHHLIFVAADREFADSMQVTVTVTSPGTSSPPPQPATGPALTIDIEPFNQRSRVTGIWIDDRRVADGAPFDFRGLSKGVHWIRIEAALGTLTDTATWTGEERRISFFLTEGYGRLRVSAEFPGEENYADIFVDDRDIGRGTPHEARDLLIGPHKIEVRKEGYRAVGGPRIVRVTPTGTNEVSFRMQPR